MGRLEALPPAPPEKREVYHDTQAPGLVVRVTDTGSKTFCLVRRVEGRMARLTLGRYPAMTVEDARRMATEHNGAIAKGANPARERRKFKADPTLAELIAWYLDTPGQRKASTIENYRWLATKHLEGIGKAKASTITRADLRTLHTRLTRDHGDYVANRALVLVRAVFNRAIKEELIETANPAAGLELNREESREVRLLPSQLGDFIRAVEEYPDPDLRDFFSLCLLTGQRKANLLAMRWEDVHLGDRLWIIPETKNGRSHAVPLEDDEVAILERRRVTVKGPWVFPSHGRTGHLVEPKGAWRAILKRSGIPHGALRIHDLRRSFGSLMVDGGESLPTIGKALGHMSQLTTAIYARLSLEPVREAKRKVHAAIAAARDGQGRKVVELAGRRNGAAK